eukprot:CAMPEP_0170620392 /NCGR_PEP_ID=MMETSP0224-20130122/28034_1 /TAXON_ID=285029 /ORGANISM="Togula jolla, Strain CCCM 725" /LENGTH=77 /DNA_ID=CAMNT_0010946563 /DNA_START=216 /DNA_END=449 /DNA_ORIENTATION=-
MCLRECRASVVIGLLHGRASVVVYLRRPRLHDGYHVLLVVVGADMESVIQAVAHAPGIVGADAKAEESAEEAVPHDS